MQQHQQWVADFLSNVALLLDSGSELDTALAALVSSETNPERCTLLQETLVGVRAGNLFSQQLRQFPTVFDGVVCSMVAAGEATGDLPTSLELVANQISRSLELKSKIINALIYPAILSVVLLLSLVLIIVYILPQLAGVVESLGGPRSWLVSGLVNIGGFVQAWGRWMLFGLVLAGGSAWVFRDVVVQYWPLGLPGFARRLRLKIELARFTGTLASLLGAGLSQVAALKIVLNGVSSNTNKANLQQVIARVEQGEPLSQALQSMGQVSQLISHGVYAGEQSGRLAETLARLSTRLEHEFELSAHRLAAVAQPILIIVMGIAIGAVMLMVFSALQSTTQVVV